jgi:hypothetical protein
MRVVVDSAIEIVPEGMHSIIKRCRQVELTRIDDADRIILELMSEASPTKMTLWPD